MFQFFFVVDGFFLGSQELFRLQDLNNNGMLEEALTGFLEFNTFKILSQISFPEMPNMKNMSIVIIGWLGKYCSYCSQFPR